MVQWAGAGGRLVLPQTCLNEESATLGCPRARGSLHTQVIFLLRCLPPFCISEGWGVGRVCASRRAGSEMRQVKMRGM